MLLVPGQGHTVVGTALAGVPSFLLLGPVGSGAIFDTLRVSIQLSSAGGAALSAGITGSREATFESLVAARDVFRGNTGVVGPFPVFEFSLVAMTFVEHSFPLGIRVDSGPLFVVLQSLGATAQIFVKASLSVLCLVADDHGSGSGSSAEGAAS